MFNNNILEWNIDYIILPIIIFAASIIPKYITAHKIDAELNKDIALQYSISSVPTLIFEKDGSVLHRHTGVMSRSQLEATINKFR